LLFASAALHLLLSEDLRHHQLDMHVFPATTYSVSGSQHCVELKPKGFLLGLQQPGGVFTGAGGGGQGGGGDVTLCGGLGGGAGAGS
jgi:hypothetical protein